MPDSYTRVTEAWIDLPPAMHQQYGSRIWRTVYRQGNKGLFIKMDQKRHYITLDQFNIGRLLKE